MEFAAKFSSAFNLYLEATKAFLHLSRTTAATPTFQAQCKANAERAIQRAEKIKEASKTPGAQLDVVAPPVNAFGLGEDSEVSSMQSLTMAQITKPMCSESRPRSIISIILSGTNPSHGHPIQEPVTRTCISFPTDSSHIAYCSYASDPHGQPTVPPSRTTSSTAITWRRPPRDLLTPQELSSNLTPAHIDQNVVNDCSFCAAVAVCIQHNQRFNSRVRLPARLPPLEVVCRSRPIPL